MRTRAGAAVLVACLVAGCHGGGGDAPPPNPSTAGQQFIVTPANIGFTAAGIGSPTPPTRNTTATVTGPAGGTLFARLVITGNAVDPNTSSVTILNPTQARVTLQPRSPAVLGLGKFTSTVTIIACSTDTTCSGAQIGGSPATVNVEYQVGVQTPPPESLAPSVGAASVAGDVVLRGTGFASVTSVSFGGTPASDFTAMSDSEIRATYPALAAGTLPISLASGLGPVAFGQSLTLVPAGTLAAATLAYSTPPQNMRGLAFDPVTQTLFVGVGFSSPTNNQVLSYTFAAGLWQLPQQATAANLRNIALSLDRTRLLALTDTSVVELSPAALIVQATTLPTDVNTTTPDAFLKGIVATNDGQALITSSSPTATGQHWLYTVGGVAPHTITGPLNSYAFPETGGPDNGTRAVIVQGGAALPVQQYNAFTGVVSASTFSLSHFQPVAGRVENINLPAFDRNGNRMLVAGFNAGTFHAVYDANFDELGRLPSGDLTATTAAYAISPDAARAYILQIGAGICRVRAFDIRQPAGPGVQYQEVTTVGFPINLSSSCPSSAFDQATRILVNPPGDILLIAGNLRISVVRLPG